LDIVVLIAKVKITINILGIKSLKYKNVEQIGAR
jgi:hypothetical protein